MQITPLPGAGSQTILQGQFLQAELDSLGLD